MIHVIVDYRVGICPFNVNKWNVADTLLPHGAVELSFHNALNDRSAEHDVAGITARICTTLENSGNISNNHSRAFQDAYLLPLSELRASNSLASRT